MLNDLWNKIKDWSGWSTAGTIFKARIEQVIGVVGAGAAGLLAFDWMPYITETISWTQMAAVSGYLFVTGIVAEVTRRWNTKTVNGQLVPVKK